MSEETAGVESAPEGPGAGVDPVAVALALGSASHAEANAFLRDQRAFVADQRHHLHEQFKRVKMGVIGDRLSIMLKLLTALIGVAITAIFAWMIWSASQSNDVIIDAFSVPLDMASRGLTGQAVANLLLDKLAAIQSATNSGRVAKANGNGGGGDLKVEIPETGVSVEEAYRFLCGWLGHQTHVRGEIYHAGSGIAINARTGDEPGQQFSGVESDLDAMIQQVAGSIYRKTQPYRYAMYLLRTDNPESGLPHLEEARAMFQRLTNDPSPVDRDYAWNALGNIAVGWDGDSAAAVQFFRRPYSTDLVRGIAQGNLASVEFSLGHFEASLAALQLSDKLTESGRADIQYPEYLAPLRAAGRGQIALLLGDYPAAAAQFRKAMDLPGLTPHNPIDPGLNLIPLAQALAGQHDAHGAIAVLKQQPATVPSWIRLSQTPSLVQIDVALGHWQAVADAVPPAEKAVAASKVKFDVPVVNGRDLVPLLALAKANLGDVAGAQALIAATPADCYPCLVIRAQIAGAAKQWGRADTWFAKADAAGPSIPFADEAWGRVLLAHGDAPGAALKFKASNAKGPHFSDALEGWGEALMAKNQSHLALAKFAEAEKYAPNWGRLHLKWGEALVYSGKPADAKAHFARAAALDLTPSEKSELARHS